MADVDAIHERRPGAADTAHSPMSYADLIWCSRRSRNYGPALSSQTPPWWGPTTFSPVIHAAQVNDYMVLVDNWLQQRMSHLPNQEMNDWRWLQQHQLARSAKMTWEGTIEPLLDLDEWEFGHCLVFQHFVRFRLPGILFVLPGYPLATADEPYVQQPLAPLTERLASIRGLCTRLPMCERAGKHYEHKCITLLWNYAFATWWPNIPEAIHELVYTSLTVARRQIQHMVDAEDRAMNRPSTESLPRAVYVWAFLMMEWEPKDAAAFIIKHLATDRLLTTTRINWLLLGAVMKAACARSVDRTVNATARMINGEQVHAPTTAQVGLHQDEALWHAGAQALEQLAHSSGIGSVQLAQVLMCLALPPTNQLLTARFADWHRTSYADAVRRVASRLPILSTYTMVATAAGAIFAAPNQLKARIDVWQQLLITVSHRRLQGRLSLHLACQVYLLVHDSSLDAPFCPSDTLAVLQMAYSESYSTT